MMLRAVTSVTLPSLSVTATVFGPVSLPLPMKTVMLFFFIRKPMPLTSLSETWRERLTATL